MEEDTEENYRKYLAGLIGQTNSRGGTRYYNKHVNRCREQAAARYPKGSSSAGGGDRSFGMAIAIIAIVIAVMVAISKHH